jgi:hypothetical protein
MAVTIVCDDGSTFQANTVGPFGGGPDGGTPGIPIFPAKRLNLTMADVQRTIQEGRASGIKPFNLFNSFTNWQSGL